MSDFVPITAGTGTSIAADLISSVYYQRVKVTFGVDGSSTDVSASDPLPITGALTDTQLRASAVPVSGTFYQATQPVSGTVSVSGSVAVTGTFFQATQPVSGTVTANAGSGTFAVSGTFWQATQPVSGTVTANAGTGTFAISAASLPLPSGAATSANQSTIITAVQGATPAGENHIGQVGGNSSVATGSFTRPADTTAYAVGDLIANSTTAGSVTPVSLAAARINAGTGVIRRVRLSTSKTSLTGAESFRVHLFKTSPTVTNGDNGAFSANGVASTALGVADITLTSVYNDGSKGYTATDIVFVAGASTTNIFALLESRYAYTPASGEVFTIALEALQD